MEKGTYPAWWHPLRRQHRTQSESARMKAEPSNEQSVCCQWKELAAIRGVVITWFCEEIRALPFNAIDCSMDTIPGVHRSDETCNKPHQAFSEHGNSCYITFQHSPLCVCLLRLKESAQVSVTHWGRNWVSSSLSAHLFSTILMHKVWFILFIQESVHEQSSGWVIYAASLLKHCVLSPPHHFCNYYNNILTFVYLFWEWEGSWL